MSREMVVVGAGMVGVSIAWHLQQRGHRVTLVDRREPGRETSYGNAGIIQREAVRPYPFPRDLATLMRVAPNRQVDIRYRPSAMMSTVGPLLKYWQNSSADRYEKIVPEYASLISRCLDAHGPMIEAAGAGHLVSRAGWFEVYRTDAGLAARAARAREDAQRFGLNFRVLDGAELASEEPHLSRQLVGAIHWQDPWTVADPGALVAAYAQAFVNAGGRIVRSEVRSVNRIDGGERTDGGGHAGESWKVTTADGDLKADEVVMALGPWTQEWLKQFGLSIPLFVKRGYHMHYEHPADKRLCHWVMDAEVGYLLAPMQAGIRLTTGAELDRLEAPPHSSQLAAAERKARRLFPMGERLEAQAWKGARPCTPDMKPIIGPVPGQQGLWLACGHGHQGFTLGPVTGKLLTQMIEGETPDVDMQPFRVERFS
ncbi:NAD(P)/FAD-dependent oxidoreductase [Halomonas cupida]|uniref:NAD(P)/FAD-dependent oxidoreductase n=1 Tax=Halomonas cupida TaxID=44933 RepID=UPI003A95057D